MAGENEPPDRNAAKVALLDQLADDALWTANSCSSRRDESPTGLPARCR
jgi:hypothetical protein